MHSIQNRNILSQILAIKRLGKKGFGEKSLFNLLMAVKNRNLTSIIEFLSINKGDYGFTDDEIERVSNAADKILNVERYFDRCLEQNIGICSVLDESFPQVLIGYHSLPIFFYKGDIGLLGGQNLAIVGTRSPTEYGIAITENIVKSLGSSVNIVSGGAYGIDSVAHNAALKSGAKTIVVFGTSINKPYPQENSGLFNRIVERGGVLISAYEPDEEFNEYSFPKRNQYIVELSKAVVIVEGGEKSGAEITAEYALLKSIPLFAVPGPITSQMSLCPNRLIYRGARILYSVDLIKEFFNLTSENKTINASAKTFETVCDLSPDERDILSLLSDGNFMHIDEIVVKSNKKVEFISEILLALELKGVVEQMPGKIYKRRSF